MVGLWTATAAGAPRVALVVAPDTSFESAVTAQLRAELSAAGFEVIVTRGTTPEASREILEDVARETDSFAAIAIVEPTEAPAVDIWVADRVTGKTVLRRIDAGDDPRQGPGIVALRAAELLRASLLELHLPDRPRGEVEPAREVRSFVQPAPTAPAPDRPPPREPAPERERFGVGLGGALWLAPGGIPAAPAPRLSIWWRPLEDWAAGIALSGPAVGSVSGESGSASIDQELALLELRYEPPFRPIAPIARAGVGAFRLGARGAARDPLQDRSGAALAFAAAVGGGARLPLARHVSLMLDATAIGLFPKPVVRFAGERVAETGRPLLLMGMSVEVGW